MRWNYPRVKISKRKGGLHQSLWLLERKKGKWHGVKPPTNKNGIVLGRLFRPYSKEGCPEDRKEDSMTKIKLEEL